MDMEIRNLKCDRTISEVDLPAGRKTVKSKWVFKRKTHLDGSLDNFEARIVAKGFSQRPGEYFYATLSPVV
uniref:Reverse transcriptase Ty1/copia-type domain-containing protein n=1 Tax=Peronospora matthiolae TaxID=2874970 RepID=A0AAV1U1S9_9STRA